MSRFRRIFSAVILATVTVTFAIVAFLQIIPKRVKIDDGNFPDAVFRQYVFENFDYDKNWVIDENEQSIALEMDISDKEIVSLKGIEYFPFLQVLDCSNNHIEKLDVSVNTELKTLDCGNNHLTNLDTSKNTDLEILDCGRNDISNLDVSNNLNLVKFDCSYNLLEMLDLSNCAHLEQLVCIRNVYLSSLKLNGCESLSKMFIYGTSISSLDVSDCPSKIYMPKDPDWWEEEINIVSREDQTIQRKW